MFSIGFIFFFSSRRRHTRSKRDWSSDVCSSDLAIKAHEADLITHSADPNHAKARFSAAMVHFDNRSALNDRRGVFQASKIGRASWRERGEVSGGGGGVEEEERRR